MFRKFMKDTDGNATVEFALWLPVVMGIVMLAADASLLMARQAELYDVSRNIARQIVVGTLEEADVDDVIALRWNDPEDYSHTVENVSGMVVVTLSVPFSDVMVFGRGFAGDSMLSGRVVMALEAV